MAKKKGRVHPPFQKRVTQLRKSAAKTADALRGQGQRDWAIPDELKDKELTKIKELHDPAFNRDEINANYEECLASAKDPGTGGDLSGLKTQVDFMSTEEQAFREEHCGIVRAFVHGHARFMGHGKDQSIFDAVAKQATDLIAAGAGGKS